MDEVSAIWTDTPTSVRALVVLGIVSALANLVGWTCCAVLAWCRNRPRKRGPDGRFKARPLTRSRRAAKDSLDLTEDDI